MTILRTDPFLIDINLVSTIDLQANISDYVSLLENFADECVLNNTFWHTDSHSDPITSKIDFFTKLNNNQIKSKDNPHGAKKRNIDTKMLHRKNYEDQVPDDVILKVDSNKHASMIDPTTITGTKTTITREWVLDGDDYGIQSNGKWEHTVNTQAVEYSVEEILPIQATPPELQEEFGMKDMTSWFVLWWLEKFYTTHNVVRQQLVEMLGEQNEFFVKFSDSVGQLKNITDTRDTSTLPVWDTNVEAFGLEYSTPSTVAGVSKYCLLPESVALCEQLSKNTNQIFRSNIANMMEDASRDEIISGVMPSFSNQSHGNNLVTDNMHITRMFNFVETVRNVIQDHLKGLYGVLELLSNRENYMIVNKPKQILLKVENFTTAVDVFKNKIKSFDKTSESPVSRYGKSMIYGTNNRNQSLSV